MDATIVLAAVPMLPNVHTIVVPSLDDVVEMVADVESDSDDESNAGEDGPEVAFVTNSLLELLASVPSLVASLSDLSENEDFFRRLATKSPQTKQLVLYDYELAFPDRLVGFALDALRSCPQLSDLKLVIMEEVDDCEALRQFVLPPGCRLRHLSLTTYSGYTTGMCKLVGKLAPVLQSLDLDFQAFRPSERTGLARHHRPSCEPGQVDRIAFARPIRRPPASRTTSPIPREPIATGDRNQSDWRFCCA